MRTAHPSFAVIIPTYRRPPQLAMCLAALTRLNYPRERFEVIVVDDGSAAPPEEVVNLMRDQLTVRLIVQDHAGPASARNTGAAHAQGEFLAFTDDDCVPDSDWLCVLAESLTSNPDHAVGGRTINALPGNPYSTTSQELVSYLYTQFASGKSTSRFFTSNNLAVRARHFAQVGGFDRFFPFAAAEDRDFCDRWSHAGRNLQFVPDAVVYHRHALTFRTFWQQHFYYGRSAYHFHKLRAARNHAPIRLEPLTFYLNLLAHPFTMIRWRRIGLLVACLTVVSQVANLAGYWTERRSDA